ncbi:MAG: hypothetical protein RLO50_19430 [Azospirillaceae bacterium]
MTDAETLTPEIVGALHDGELSPEETSRVLRALLADAAARAELEALAAIHRTLATALSEVRESPDSRDIRLVSRLAQRLDNRPMLTRWGPQSFAAGIAFAGGLAFGSFVEELSPWAIPSIVEEASQAHQVFVYDDFRPVELGPGSADVIAEWFSDHLHARVSPPDLSTIGLRFIGGRLLSAEVGPMAQLVYEDQDGVRVALYAVESADTGDGEVETVTVDDLVAGYWRQGDVVYTVIGDHEWQRVIDIATQMGHGPLDEPQP